MKRFILLCFLSALISNLANAQLDFGYHFKMKNAYRWGGDLGLSYRYTNPSTNMVVVANKRIWNQTTKANLKADSNGIIKVNFFSITRSNASDTSFVLPTDSANNFFLIINPKRILSDPSNYRSFPYVTTQIGIITLPLKYRFGNKTIPNNFSTEINAGIYVGRRWGRARFYTDVSKNHESASLTVAIFAGPTKVSITKETVKDTASFKRDSDEIGISYGAGMMYSYRKFNVGVFGGIDTPLSKPGNAWIYENRLWLGFGIGYMINIIGGGKE